MYRDYKAYLEQKEYKMEYNFLAPNCGLKVSAICLGTMTFKKEGKTLLKDAGAGEKESHAILDRFYELGGNFLDSADVYEGGESEEIVGDWMKKHGNRRDVVVATKGRFYAENVFAPDPTKPNRVGLSRNHIIDAVEDSLKRLQTDYIDLYQIHGPDPGTPYDELLRTLDDLIRCGKIRYAGACNLKGWQTQKIVERTKALGINPFVSLQQHYCLLERGCEQEAFEVCLNEGLGVLPWSALKGGLLSGKYERGASPPAGTRLDWGKKNQMDMDAAPDWDRVLKDERVWTLLDAMKDIANNHGKTVAQVALRWLLQTPPVSSVIIGTTKIHQLEDNCGAVGWRLTEEEMAELNKLSGPQLSYPYGFLAGFTEPGRWKTPAFV